jgi:hypothetical protein
MVEEPTFVFASMTATVEGEAFETPKVNVASLPFVALPEEVAIFWLAKLVRFRIWVWIAAVTPETKASSASVVALFVTTFPAPMTAARAMVAFVAASFALTNGPQ